MSETNRALIIGLDGATWDVLTPWMNDGTLPHLAQLCHAGSWGKLQSSIPPITAPAWSTFMTGKQPGKHGVFHFVRLFDNEDSQASDEKPEIVNARTVKSSTWWDILGHSGYQVGLVNVPMTYPPRPINGFMITGLLTPKNASTFTYPGDLGKELEGYIIDLDRFIENKPYQSNHDQEAKAPSLAMMQEFRTMLEKRASTSLALMDSKPWDAFMVVFTGPDRMGHYLWPYHLAAGRVGNADQGQELFDAVRDYYVRLDEIIGDLLRAAGKDAVVLLMSDHGMGPICTKRVHWNNWLLEHGWLSVQKSDDRGFSADSWLRRLRLPRDKIGRILMRIPGLAKSKLVTKTATAPVAEIDKSRSKAWCVHIYNTVFGIRLNASDQEKEVLQQEISDALRQVVDPETGQRIVQQVLSGKECYHGLYAKNIPDIIVVLDGSYTPGYRVSHYSSLVTSVQSPPEHGDHRMDGIFAAYGPGIVSNSEPLPGLSIQDIAPTLLYLMGLPVPSDMDGRVLTEIVAADVLNAQPVEYGDPVGRWPDEERAVFGDEVTSSEDDEVLRDRLRALGYI
ncbi:MAG: alkaline phosphatase family protein [Anaerolineae bacterium]|nr:alkaline phosphatase family protein [Anaerolineae bacterium]